MVKKGFYKHFKGHIYYVLGVGCLAHESNRRVVVYTSVKTETDNQFEFLLRDEEDFEKWIKNEEGAKEEALAPDSSSALAGLILAGFEPRFALITDPIFSKIH